MLKLLPLWTALAILAGMLACTTASPAPIPTETPTPSANRRGHCTACRIPRGSADQHPDAHP